MRRGEAERETDYACYVSRALEVPPLPCRSCVVVFGLCGLSVFVRARLCPRGAVVCLWGRFLFRPGVFFGSILELMNYEASAALWTRPVF